MTLPKRRPRPRPAIDLVFFRWTRPAPSGLRLETRRRAPVETPSAITAETRWLVPTADGGTSYDPFGEEPSLFRLFAELPPTDDAATLAFAQKFGVLGISELSVVERDAVTRLLTTAVMAVEHYVPAESLDLWAREVRAMRHAVDVFDALQGRNHETLARWITVSPEGVVQYRREDALGSSQIGAGLPTGMKADGPTSALMAVARHVLDEELIKPRLRDYVSLFLIHAGRERRSRLRAVPANLLGALWLQLARAVDGDIHYRRCAWRPCQKWIEITRTFDGHTKAARFCSDAHRVYDYKKRHPKKRRKA